MLNNNKSRIFLIGVLLMVCTLILFKTDHETYTVSFAAQKNAYSQPAYVTKNVTAEAKPKEKPKEAPKNVDDKVFHNPFKIEQAVKTVQKDNKTVRISYTHLGNVNVCKTDKPLDFIVVCITVADRFKQREGIRQNIDTQLKKIQESNLPYKNLTLKYQFVIGQMKNTSKELADKLAEENKKHNDVIQGNFLDIYVELPMKSLFMYNWVINYCSSARIMMKIDDDIDFYLDPFFKYFSALPDPDPGDWLAGRIYTGSRPFRNPGSKWYAPVSLYPKPVYPPYAVGFGYFVPLRSVPKMFQAILEVPTFYIDDVYVGGICREHAKIKPINVNFICPFTRKNANCAVCH